MLRMWGALTCPVAGAFSLSCVVPAPTCPKGIAEPLPEPQPELLPGPAGQHSNPFRSSAPGVWRALPTSSVSDPGNLGASLPVLGSCQSSLQVPFHPGRLVNFLLLQVQLSCPGGTGHPALARLLAGPLPLG